MKIVFINAPCLGIDDDRLEPSLGSLYIASTLRKNGYDNIEMYEMTGCKTEKDIYEKINNIPLADVYSFTTYCTNYNNIKKCIKYIRIKSPDSIIVLGGPNASALPEFTFKDSGCDYVVIGEGEDAFLKIINSINYMEFIPLIINGIGRENIDTLPLPGWDLVDLHKFNRVLDGERVISILSSRGCPNNCTHCNSVVMGAGRKIRYRSTENIIEEIKYLQSLGYNNFRFNDDNFVCRPNIKELTNELKKLNIKYRAFAHIKDLTDETCKLLSESGCLHISIGIESMNPDNLKFLRKNTNVEMVDINLRNVKRYNMISRVYFIVGLIADTDKTIEQYMTIASLLDFDEFSAYPLICYPGTAIYNTPEKFGYKIIEKDWTKYYQIGENRATCFALDHTNFTHKDVEKWLKFTYNILENKGKIQNGNSVTK